MYAILKKKYSQNFLIDKNIQKKICRLISSRNLNILEIGPGDGRLTDHILQLEPRELTLIEIDKDLIDLLNKKLSKNKNVKVINEDILNYHLIENFDLIISNLPYNISSQVLVKICLMQHLPLNLILMFQKEFAERLISKKLNSLNSLVGCFYDINTCISVSKNCFRPVPRIDSTVLLFKRRNEILLERNEIDNFIEFKRNLFSHKRKTLKNILRDFGLNQNKFDLSLRVEEISLQELLRIFRETNL